MKKSSLAALFFDYIKMNEVASLAAGGQTQRSVKDN